MPAAMKSPPTPRYGSASQVASYAGLSPKTVRRLVGAGSVRGRKVGRRLLIPFEDVDCLILDGPCRRPGTQEAPTMATASTSDSPCSVDTATGRLRPVTDQERRTRTEALGRALDEIAGMTDETDTDEVWRGVLRGIDEGRPHRPLFEGSY